MNSGGNVDRDRRAFWISAIAIVGSGLLDFLSNVLANYVHPTAGWFRHDWVLVLSAAVSSLGMGGLVWFGYRWLSAERSRRDSGPEPDAAQPGRAFPPAAGLIGRNVVVRATVARARRHGFAVVTGPAGIGASAVALRASWELAPTPDRQLYVDLRGSAHGPESPRRAVIRVLRVIGTGPGAAKDPRQALATMAATLRGSGIVLLLDNVERAEQVAWIADGVPGAYVIACGDLPDRELPGGIDAIRVPPLGQQAALDLLARQDDGPMAAIARRAVPGPVRAMRRLLSGRLAELAPRLLSGHLGSPANTIRERIDADPGAAAELARSYLTLPRVAIDMGRWLAANPQVTLGALLHDLRGTEPSSELAFILRKQLDGTSPGARRLLALLSSAPATELPQAAIAALADTGFDRTGGYLAELASRSLVEWSRPSRCRVIPQARWLTGPPEQKTDPTERKAVARSHVRLTAYYAKLAVARGTVLESGRVLESDDVMLESAGPVLDSIGPEAEEWLRSEDTALLELLTARRPPVSAARHLWQIAGVLDSWFAREHRPEDRWSAAQAMADAAAYLHDDTAHAVANLRMAAVAREEGDLTAAGQHLERADGLLGRGSPLRCQLHAAWAVYLMTVGDLDAAWDHLLRCRESRSPRDVRGRVADLVNQAAVEARLGRVEAARGTLNQAHALSERAPDLDGHAHAHELLGVAEWLSGHPHRASGEWRRALELYAQASDLTGQARCLQHLGTAALSDPSARDDRERRDGQERAEGREDAAELLAVSLDLRGDQEPGLGAALAHLYLAESGQLSAAELTAHRQAGLAALRAWPHQGSEPPEVTRARARLTALKANALSPGVSLPGASNCLSRYDRVDGGVSDYREVLMAIWAWILIAIAVVAVVAVVVVAARQRQTAALRQRFGPEYDRTLAARDDRRAAEAELRERERQRAELDIRPLSDDARAQFAREWFDLQERFVDEPSDSVVAADGLVYSVMEARGYPMRDFDAQADLVSVDHPELVENYRFAHGVRDRAQAEQASTEDLREALLRYRSLFSELLEARDDQAGVTASPRTQTAEEGEVPDERI